jgi:predicted dehydrogenase
VAASIFGKGGVEYDLPFPTSDAGQIAIEQHDFARAVLNNGNPEIDGHGGLTALAAVLGVFESSKVGRPVTMDEMLTSAVSGYQDDLDRGLGLLN